MLVGFPITDQEANNLRTYAHRWSSFRCRDLPQFEELRRKWYTKTYVLCFRILMIVNMTKSRARGFVRQLELPTGRLTDRSLSRGRNAKSATAAPGPALPNHRLILDGDGHLKSTFSEFDMKLIQIVLTTLLLAGCAMGQQFSCPSQSAGCSSYEELLNDKRIGQRQMPLGGHSSPDNSPSLNPAKLATAKQVAAGSGWMVRIVWISSSE